MDYNRKDNSDPKKTPKKKLPPNNNRHITFLPIVLKIVTAQSKEEIYDSLINNGLFPVEQKGYCKWTSGTGELLHIGQHIFKESKT